MPGPRQLRLVEWQPRDLDPGEVRLDVYEVGGCQSEVDRWLGNAPDEPHKVIGHEIAGRVIEIGSAVKGVEVGQLVAVQADGGFADEVIAPADWCVPVLDNVHHPSIIEPLGCTIAAVERINPPLGATVVITGGTGSMGELAQRVFLLRTPGTLIVTGRRPDALARAQALGAVAVNTNYQSLRDVVDDLTGGGGADVVCDFGGLKQTIDLAVAAAAREAVLGLAGFTQRAARLNLGEIQGKRLRLENCHFEKPQVVDAMRRAVTLVENGQLDLSDLVSDVVAFRDVPRGLKFAADKGRGFRRWKMRRI